MSSELKACPFCGSDADNTGQNKEFVSCSSPDCSQRWGWYKVDWWNRRSPSPAVLALATACRRMMRVSVVAGLNLELRDALAAVEREIGDQFADASKKVEGGSDAHR